MPVTRCVARDVSFPRNLKKKKRDLPSDEQIHLVQQSINRPFGLFAFFLLYAGCRRGEALALRYGDIDRKSKWIHVTRSLCWYNNAPDFKSPKTEAGKRDIVLLDKLNAVLPKGKRDDLLFPDKDGNVYTGTRFQHDWRRYCEETGVKITPHQLRHATAAMTQDIYTHLRSTRKQQTADLLNQKIGSIL